MPYINIWRVDLEPWRKRNAPLFILEELPGDRVSGAPYTTRLFGHTAQLQFPRKNDGGKTNERYLRQFKRELREMYLKRIQHSIDQLQWLEKEGRK